MLRERIQRFKKRKTRAIQASLAFQNTSLPSLQKGELQEFEELFSESSSHSQIHDQKAHLGGANQRGNPNSFTPAVWGVLYELFRPRTFIDFGCGLGQTIGYFQGLGVESKGVEGSRETIKNSEYKDSIIRNDYTYGVALQEGDVFDLGYSQEFVEHIEEKDSWRIISDFKHCRHLALTHGLPGQPGHNHVNCRTSRYWVKALQQEGFILDKEISLLLRRLALYESRMQSQVLRNHTKWFARTGMVFHKVM